MKKFTTVIFSIFLTILNVSAQNVGVDTNDPKAKLDVVSSTSGVRIPQITLTSKTTMAPVIDANDSELIYNTNTNGTVGSATYVYPGYYYWSTATSEWIRLAINDEVIYDWIEATTSNTPAVFTDHQYVTGNVGIGDFSTLTPSERLEVLDGDAQITSASSGQTPSLHFDNGNPGNTISKNTNQKARINFWEPNGKGNWGMYMEHFDDDGTYCPSRGGGALLNHFNIGSVKAGVYNPIISINDGNTYTGRVGIGTSDPEQDLHIVGTTRIGTLAGTESRLVLADSDGDLSTIANGTADQILISNGTTLNWQDGNTLDDHDWHKTNGTADQGKATTIGDNIYTNGNVGIGSVKPNVSLYVMSPGQTDQYVARFTQSNVGAAGISTFIGLGTEDDYAGVWSKGAIGYQRTAGYDVGDITFNINSATDLTSASEADEKMRITSAGNVGIGTTGPNQKLQVNGNIRLEGTARTIIFGETAAEGGPSGLEFSNEISLLYRTTPDDLSFEHSDGTKIMTVDRGAKSIGIGTDEPSQSLDVASGSMIVRQGNGGGASTLDQIFFGYNNGTLYRQAIRTQHHSGQGENSGTPMNTIDFFIWNNGIASDAEPTDKVMSITNGGVLGRFRHITHHDYYQNSYYSGGRWMWIPKPGAFDGAETVDNRDHERNMWLVPYSGRIVSIMVSVDNYSSNGGYEISNGRFLFAHHPNLNEAGGCGSGSNFCPVSTSDAGKPGQFYVLSGNASVNNSGGYFSINESPAGVIQWRAEGSDHFSFNKGDKVAIGINSDYIEDNAYQITVVWEYDIWE